MPTKRRLIPGKWYKIDFAGVGDEHTGAYFGIGRLVEREFDGEQNVYLFDLITGEVGAPFYANAIGSVFNGKIQSCHARALCQIRDTQIRRWRGHDHIVSRMDIDDVIGIARRALRTCDF